MPFTFRTLNPETDYESLAQLITLFEGETVSAERLRDADARSNPDQICRRWVVTDSHNSVIGYAATIHEGWDSVGRFWVWSLVHPSQRGQGIGGQLYEMISQFVNQHNATLLTTNVRDDHPEARIFAEKRGFALWRHMFESTIDLRSFDETLFADVKAEVEASGIRIFSLADVGDTEDARRKLHHVNYMTYLDDPASTGDFPDFDEFNKMFNTVAWFRPEGQLLAADGDNYVGLSAVGYFKDTNSMYNMMTGVMKEYRGRKIAHALKLASIRFAKNFGADYIRTNNDSENAPMLAINRKLGYVAEPGIYRMRKSLG